MPRIRRRTHRTQNRVIHDAATSGRGDADRPGHGGVLTAVDATAPDPERHCAPLIDSHVRTDLTSGAHTCDGTAGQSERSHGERVHV
jgi:hypothetical protein